MVDVYQIYQDVVRARGVPASSTRTREEVEVAFRVTRRRDDRGTVIDFVTGLHDDWLDCSGRHAAPFHGPGSLELNQRWKVVAMRERLIEPEGSSFHRVTED